MKRALSLVSVLVLWLGIATSCSPSASPNPAATKPAASQSAQSTPASTPASQLTVDKNEAKVTVESTKAQTARAEPTEAPAAQTKIDPCTLLTKQDAEAALGESVSDAKTLHQSIGGGVMNQCQYLASAETSSRDIAVQVVQKDPDSSREWDPMSYWTNLPEGYKVAKLTAEPVSGLGDEAFFVSKVAEGRFLRSVLHLRKGELIFAVYVPGEGSNALEMAKSLAQKVVGRI